MDIIFLKKLFTKEQANLLLKGKCPELWRIPYRCRKERFVCEDTKCVYEGILKHLSIQDVIYYTRDFSINNINGKYQNIHRNPEKTRELIRQSNIKKEDSPCYPQNFSESVVKPNVRECIGKYFDTDNYAIFEEIDKKIEIKLKNHIKERVNQQIKGDYSEYLILMSSDNIIPTLKHSKGTDMFIKEDDEIVPLNIKTTRNVWGLDKNPEEAIKQLYEKQGEDRFEFTPRLYIYLSDRQDLDYTKINEQLAKTYNIAFMYKGETYDVYGCRFIVV
tara:strand:- start:4098 stop:4922 length:825 start_codon:yes stop_codon:yes gene_type:complete